MEAQDLVDENEAMRTARQALCLGSAEEMLKHLYEPFFTTKGPGKGTGLGLFTCYRTLVRHGGDIQVESREGEGSVFSVTLPIYVSPVCQP